MDFRVLGPFIGLFVWFYWGLRVSRSNPLLSRFLFFYIYHYYIIIIYYYKKREEKETLSDWNGTVAIHPFLEVVSLMV